MLVSFYPSTALDLTVVFEEAATFEKDDLIDVRLERIVRCALEKSCAARRTPIQTLSRLSNRNGHRLHIMLRRLALPPEQQAGDQPGKVWKDAAS